jgi:hypothetical protein
MGEVLINVGVGVILIIGLAKVSGRFKKPEK